MKYTATFSVNNGSTYGRYEYGSLREARKEIRAIALGNLHEGATGSWSVYRDAGPDNEDIEVASGFVR